MPDHEPDSQRAYPPDSPLIDPEGRCERCGRLVPLECPEPDGIGCGSYVLEVTAEEGVDTAALVERLRVGMAERRAAELQPFVGDGAEPIREGLERMMSGHIVPGSVRVHVPEADREDRYYEGVEWSARLVYGIRPHLPMTAEEHELAKMTALAGPLDPAMLALAEPLAAHTMTPDEARATCPPEPPPGARSILWQEPWNAVDDFGPEMQRLATGPGQAGVIIARRITGEGEIRGPTLVVTHDLDVPPECNGEPSARWCPVHGDCTCPTEEDGSWVERYVEHAPLGLTVITMNGTLPGSHIEVQHDPACPLHGPTSTHCEDPLNPPPPRSVEVTVQGSPSGAVPPGIVWSSANDAPPSDEPCEDCDGTGWASESNPGTGGGTGRDEQIAVPCPRGCQEPPCDNPAHGHCGQQVVSATSNHDGPEASEPWDWYCPHCRVYLGDQDDLHDPRGPNTLAEAFGPAPTGEEMTQDAVAWAQEHQSGAHTSAGPDGRLTTVYPSGESYTDPTPRLDPEPDITEEAFFSAMDDIVERVTGTRPKLCQEPHAVLDDWEASRAAAGSFARGTRVVVAAEPGLVGEVIDPPTILFGGLTDLARVWVEWPDGGVSGHEPHEVSVVGARGCEADDQGPEDGAF